MSTSDKSNPHNSATSTHTTLTLKCGPDEMIRRTKSTVHVRDIYKEYDIALPIVCHSLSGTE